eukprot:jgi/Tetstr1/435680/TSEL_024580.t1
MSTRSQQASPEQRVPARCGAPGAIMAPLGRKSRRLENRRATAASGSSLAQEGVGLPTAGPTDTLASDACVPEAGGHGGALGRRPEQRAAAWELRRAGWMQGPGSATCADGQQWATLPCAAAAAEEEVEEEEAEGGGWPAALPQLPAAAMDPPLPLPLPLPAAAPHPWRRPREGEEGAEGGGGTSAWLKVVQALWGGATGQRRGTDPQAPAPAPTDAGGAKPSSSGEEAASGAAAEGGSAPGCGAVRPAGSAGSTPGSAKRSRFWSPSPLPARLSLEQQDDIIAWKRRSPSSKSPRQPKSARRSHFFRRKQGDVRRRSAQWEPPQSPFGLIQEQVYSDPWKVLLCCILLNKTTITQVRRVVWDLLQLCPCAEAAVATDAGRIEEIIWPLGMQRKRAADIKRFSLDFLEKDWESPLELHGIGKYGSDAYAIFCEGNWQGVEPQDKELRAYHQWLKGTHGLGSGLERDEPPLPMSALAAQLPA